MHRRQQPRHLSRHLRRKLSRKPSRKPEGAADYVKQLRADGKPVARTAGVIVDAEMPQHGHGMNLTPTIARAGDGLYLARGMLLHMIGRWVLSIDIEEDAIAERTQWYVDVR